MNKFDHIRRLKNCFESWYEVCEYCKVGEHYKGWLWNGVFFSKDEGETITEEEVFPK